MILGQAHPGVMVNKRMRYRELLERADTASPNFKAWFADSKVVDEHGVPLICYHGTLLDFHEYHPFTHFGTVRAAWLALNWKIIKKVSGDANIRPVYLNIRKPFAYVDYTGPDSSRDVVRQMKKRGLLSPDEVYYLRSLKNRHIREHEVIEKLSQLGYDGLMYRNNSEDKGSSSWVIFRSDQVWPVTLDRPDTINEAAPLDSNPNARSERIVSTVVKNDIEYRLIEDHIYFERVGGYVKVHRVEAWHDGRKVGHADFDERDRAWGVWVEGGKHGGQNYRKRGIATAMYDLMGAYLGKPVEPASSAQSSDAKAFWAARRSKAVGDDREIIAERAATARGSSKFIGKRGQVFYIDHREEGREVICTAYAAANSAYEPLRQRIGKTICEMVDSPYDPGRNGVRVYPFKSAVNPEWRHYGVLSAMYDHLDQHGFIVYPASGEVGDKYLQSQSEDAKAFWAARQKRTSQTRLLPVTDDERYGWRKYNPFAIVDRFGTLPVIEQIDYRGHQYPMLVLWQKTFASGPQRVGIMYDPERGYRVAVSIADPRYGEMQDLPWVRDGVIDFYYSWMDIKAKAGTIAMIRKIASMIETDRITSLRSQHRE